MDRPCASRVRNTSTRTRSWSLRFVAIRSASRPHIPARAAREDPNAQLSAEEKNAISHRGQAFRELGTDLRRVLQ